MEKAWQQERGKNYDNYGKHNLKNTWQILFFRSVVGERKIMVPDKEKISCTQADKGKWNLQEHEFPGLQGKDGQRHNNNRIERPPVFQDMPEPVIDRSFPLGGVAAVFCSPANQRG